MTALYVSVSDFCLQRTQVIDLGPTLVSVSNFGLRRTQVIDLGPTLVTSSSHDYDSIFN